MREFEGSKGEWYRVSAYDGSRAIRNEDGLICKFYTYSKYEGQTKRYLKELEETKCNQNLMVSEPELLKALQDLVRFCVENEVGADLEFANDVIDKSL